MNMSLEVINLHPGFHIAALKENRFFLVGETESYMLAGKQYHDLFKQIDGTRTIYDIISTSDDIRKQALMLEAVDELVRKGLILKKRGDECRQIYFRPDFDSKPATIHLHEGQVELNIISACVDPDILVQWVKQLTFTTPAGVVFVDDYLDPRLDDINHTFAMDKRDWLLMKPTGRKPLIGPFFSQKKENAPCWYCLKYRFIQNQPVRRWLQENHKNALLRIPGCYERNTVKKLISSSLEYAQQFIDQKRSYALLEVDPDRFTFTEHPVSVLPQCPYCGDPGIASGKGRPAITLNPCPKIHIIDGGVRSSPPLTTIDRLSRSISPLTGLIGDLSPLPDQKENGIPIYRSFFFKKPGDGQIPESNGFMQVSLGKGMSEEQSKASALCESIERLAVQFRGDEPYLFSAALNADFEAVLPHELASFSEKQYERFGDLKNSERQPHYSVKKYHEAIPIKWTWAWSFTDNKTYHLPLTFCYANTPYEGACFSRFNSNGCAAGNTLEIGRAHV